MNQMRRRIDFQLFEEFVVYSLERIMTQQEDLAAIQAKTLIDIAAMNDRIVAVGGQLTALKGQVTTLQQQLADAQAGNGDLSAAIATAGQIDTAVQSASTTLAGDLPADTASQPA